MDFDQATRSRLAQQSKSQNTAILKALEENTKVLNALVERITALESHVDYVENCKLPTAIAQATESKKNKKSED
jgi:hypothetical protein